MYCQLVLISCCTPSSLTVAFPVNNMVKIDVLRKKSYNSLPRVQITSLNVVVSNIGPRNRSQIVQCAKPDCRQSSAYSFIVRYTRTTGALCRDRTVTQGDCGTPISAGGLSVIAKGVADELQTILGRGARIGMAVPDGGSSNTGNGRKEDKSAE